MSVISEIQYQLNDSKSETLLLITKGAPEVIMSLLIEIPSDYKQIYLYHMAKGKRVLALACKKLSYSVLHESNQPHLKSREQMENKLIFLGFLVFDCELKPDSKSVIRELKDAKHQLIMITGDSPHTAADVATRLGMIPSDKSTLILQSLPSK
jgi:cation-transporting ATPase 13A1